MTKNQFPDQNRNEAVFPCPRLLPRNDGYTDFNYIERFGVFFLILSPHK